jgi:integrase
MGSAKRGRSGRTEDLTREVCSALQPGPRKYRVTQVGRSGLKFVVEPDGRKYWTFRYVTRDGVASERSLGRWPKVLPEAAAREAARIEAQLAEGLDPVKARREKREAIRSERRAGRQQRRETREKTFDWLLDAYLIASEAGLFGKGGRRKAETTIAKERQNLNKHLRPTLGPRPVAEITRMVLVETLETIASKSGHSAANTSLEVIRRAFAYGRHRGLLDPNMPNPALEIERFGTQPRHVTARDDGLRYLWALLERAKVDRPLKDGSTKTRPSYFTAAALQLSMLTLQRRGEVVRIRREDVNLEKSLWTIPAMNKKERRKGLVPLSDMAKAIIEEAIAKGGKTVWVFPGADADGEDDHLKPKTITRFLLRMRRADAEAREAAAKRKKEGASLEGDEDLLCSPSPLVNTEGGTPKSITPHDLRRTGRTRLTGDLGIDESTAERVLNHTYGSRQQNAYDWNSYIPQKRAALDAWARELSRIVYEDGVGGTPSNVVPMSTARPAA